jgi:sterol desaturase/sphingolipid hydroxylase (fatty acid hydroxylase superfamily)
MDLAEIGNTILAYLGENFTGTRSLLSPLVIGTTLGLCLAIYLYRKPGIGFWAWAFPRRIWLRRGTLTDLGLWMLGQLVTGTLILNMTAISSVIAIWLWHEFGVAPAAMGPLSLVITALVVFLLSDFCGFLVHMLFHRVRPLWPIHAVHHSAEELTPLSAFRHHPLYTLVDATVAAVVLGVVQGFLMVFATGTVDVATLAGINVFFAVFRLTGANLRHSHIWLRYPPWLEHILISPAQHQVHHSRDPSHHEKNYGEVLAVWDWMFGSLYVPDGAERGVATGLGDRAGRLIPPPHRGPWTTLVVPLREVFQLMRHRRQP